MIIIENVRLQWPTINKDNHKIRWEILIGPGQKLTESLSCIWRVENWLIAPRWASAKAICIATRFGTSPSLAEQNHRELPSIPIIIKANISQARHAPMDVMELIKHRSSVQLRNDDMHVYLPTRKRHRLQWSIAVGMLLRSSPAAGGRPSQPYAPPPAKLIPLIFEISIF